MPMKEKCNEKNVLSWCNDQLMFCINQKVQNSLLKTGKDFFFYIKTLCSIKREKSVLKCENDLLIISQKLSSEQFLT